MNTTALPPLLGHLGVLSDATRFRILMTLESREFSVSELCRILQLPQPTVSRHLRLLAEGGWVVSRSDGARRPYRRNGALGQEQAALWHTLRGAASDDPRIREDGERAEAVLAERRDRSRDFFSATADRWDSIRAELYGIRADLLPLFGLLDPGWTVADLGAGTGVLAAAVAPFVERVVVVDRSPEMLAAARERMPSSGTVEFHEGEVEQLPLADETVDVAVLSLVLHHLPDPARVLAEARRILKPGGRLVLVDIREHDRAELTEEMGHQWPGFTSAQLHAWLQAADLTPLPTVPLPPDAEARGPLLFLQVARR